MVYRLFRSVGLSGVLMISFFTEPPASGAQQPHDVARPNIVLILVDDVGYSDMSYTGSNLYETPNIDALARRGMRFSQFYASSPVCSPTRASIMTGKSPARHGITLPAGHLPTTPEMARLERWTSVPELHFDYPITKFYLEPDEYTVAEALRDAGYATAHIGKWHLGFAPEHWPDKQGFEYSLNGAPDSGTNYFSPYDSLKTGTLTGGPPGEYLTDRLTDESIRFINANRDRPFFLYLSHFALHSPYQGKKDLVDFFCDQTEPDAPPRNPVYAAMLRSLDDNIGRLIRALEEMSLVDRTVLVFTSDNGGYLGGDTAAKEFRTEPITTADGRVVGLALAQPRSVPITSNEPLRGGKGTTYEGGIRVPTIFLWPGVTTPGSRSLVPATSTDLYPTLLEIARVEPKAHAAPDGVSLVPVLRGTGPPKREALYWYHPTGSTRASATIRKGDWKLIHLYELGDELYNLADDIGETTDLVEKEPVRAHALRAELFEWLESTGARVPRPNQTYTPPGMWRSWTDATAAAVDGRLRLEPSTPPDGADSHYELRSRVFDAGGDIVIRIKMKTGGIGKGRFTWMTPPNGRWSEPGSEFMLRTAGQFHQYEIPVPATKKAIRLALHLDLDRAGTPIEVDWIRVLPAGKNTILKEWEFENE